MTIDVPLRLAAEMPALNDPRATCLNFIRFRTVLKQHRSACDDNIRQRLASLTRPDQCRPFLDNLRRAQASRLKNLNTCLQIIDAEIEKGRAQNANNVAVLLKEVHHLMNPNL